MGLKIMVPSDLIFNIRQSLNQRVNFNYDKKIEKVEKCNEGVKLFYQKDQMIVDYLIYAYSPYFITGLSQNMQTKFESDFVETPIKNKLPRDFLNFSQDITEDFTFFKNLGRN